MNRRKERGRTRQIWKKNSTSDTYGLNVYSYELNSNMYELSLDAYKVIPYMYISSYNDLRVLSNFIHIWSDFIQTEKRKKERVNIDSS